jgi:hypothetical protein
MDAIKVEPDSDGETAELHVYDQDNATQEDGVPQPFAFAAVKVEVEVRAQNLSSFIIISYAPRINFNIFFY